MIERKPGTRVRMHAPGVLLGATAAGQSTINVPGDQPTIQAGIDAAINGDTVLVAPGAYSEHDISFGGKAITVLGAGGAEVTTVLADQDFGRAFRFESGEGPDSVLDGFTMTRSDPLVFGGIVIAGASPTIARCSFVANGATGPNGPPGGAIRAIDSSAVLLECDFRDNTAGGQFQGGAVFIDNGTIEITDCSFVGNGILFSNSTVTDGGVGGAVFARGSTVVFSGCSFLGNSAGDAPFHDSGNPAVGGWGGAVYATQGSVIAVKGCRFESNLAGIGLDKPGAGGAIAIVGSTIEIENSVFARNHARAPTAPVDVTLAGAALYAGGSDSDGNVIGPYQVDILNSTFVNNGALVPGVDGGGIVIEDGADVSIRNTILWGNLPGQIESVGSPATVSYSIVEGGHAGIGNFHADPLLSADHHLLSGSPAIDTGDPDTTGLPATDGDGESRVLGAAVDIGADEFMGAQILPYGCGVNPPGSIVVLAGSPTIGTTLVLGLDNPLGTQSPGAFAPLAISLSPAPMFPCGTLLPGFGMAGSGASGELLIDLSATAVVQNSLWVGPGNAAPVLIPIPNVAILGGLNVYVQGALVDLSPGADPIVGITDALRLVIGR